MSRPKILLVEGEERSPTGLRRLLRPFRDAWDMHFYSTREHALDAALREKFDFIVSEINSPGIDGLSLLDEVRRRHPDMVRVLLSGDDRRVDKLRSTGVAHHYVYKSCPSETLEHAVRRARSLRQDLGNEQLLVTIGQTRTLPTVPSLYHRLLEELTADDPSLARIGAIVARDPAMTAQILQIINSAYFGLRRRIADIGQAVTLLGINTIMSLVLSSHLFREHNLTRDQHNYVEALWKRSVGVAQLARAIVTLDVSTRALAEEAYLAGILNGCGKLVFVTNWPRRFIHTERQGADIAAERNTFGADHAFVGGYLMASWGLPDAIVEAVAYHHQPSLCEAGGTPILAAVHVAQALQAREGATSPTLVDGDYLRNSGIAGSVDDWAAVARELDYDREYA